MALQKKNKNQTTSVWLNYQKLNISKNVTYCFSQSQSSEANQVLHLCSTAVQ